MCNRFTKLSVTMWYTFFGIFDDTSLWILPKTHDPSLCDTPDEIMYASYSKLSKELKDGIEILVGQAVFNLWIKTVKILFRSITQEPLGLLNILMLFLSSLDNLIWDAYIIFHSEKMLLILR